MGYNFSKNRSFFNQLENITSCLPIFETGPEGSYEAEEGLVIVCGCMVVRSEFLVSDFFILPLTPSTCLPLFFRRLQENLKEGRKEMKIPFNSKLYFWFHDYSAVSNIFPEPMEIVTLPRRLEFNLKTQKWYLIPPCLTLSIIRYVSKIKWSNPRKGVAPSPTPRCCSY